MKFAASALIALNVAGCALTNGSVSADRKALDSIADGCGLDPSIFELGNNRRLTINLPPNAKYEDTECILGGLKKARIPFAIGFYGNEDPNLGKEK